jgi:glycine cleavage system regulatory protein
MNTNFVISFSAQDKPGIVEQLSNTISSNHGNWLESAMSHLAGRFVGIVVIEISVTDYDKLNNALTDLSNDDFIISIKAIEDDANDDIERKSLEIELTGHDRPGIVSEVSSVLNKHNANVEDLSTYLVSGSMSAEILFKADIVASIAHDTNLDDLQEAIESIADDLMVDLHID